MKFLGPYVKKTLFYTGTATEAQRKVPITGENFINLDDRDRIVDYSKFCDIYLVFEDNGNIFVWRSNLTYGKPSPYINSNYRYVIKRGESPALSRKMLKGFDFDGLSSDRVGYKDRNFFTMGHIERNYEPLADVLGRIGSDDIVNKIVSADSRDIRLSRNFDGKFELVAILKSDCNIPRALIRTAKRKAPDMVFNVETRRLEKTGKPSERTVTHYSLVGPEYRARRSSDLRDFYHVYESNNEEEMAVYNQELAENTKPTKVSTANGEREVASFVVNFLKEVLTFVPEVYKNDYIERTLSDEQREPVDFTAETLAFADNGKSAR